MAYKQKKIVKNARNRYLKPGALAQLRDSRTTTRSSAEIAKRKASLESKKAKMVLRRAELAIDISSPIASPIRSTFQSPPGLVDRIKADKLPASPKTPVLGLKSSHSRLESLPMDLLVKIMCHLHHDQLKAVFHVSQRIRKAVLHARQFYFNYTTPDRSRQELLRTKTPLPTEHWPFTSKANGRSIWAPSPRTPKAPRQGPRPSRHHHMDIKQIAAVLFPDSLPSRCAAVPPGLPRPVFKAMASNRVLFYEDELCHAVAQNKLC
ncbi:F-box domain-containing protein [Dioscorea alata]|uniref:F-box domain-containing protein n=1 Tax=Dioscorea alata TaxID=55571 RepID=A0ACB7V621_DIOAL|nr:F-box domain-containing protein [Dioscorea alata]